jgi:hypothetical protein
MPSKSFVEHLAHGLEMRRIEAENRKAERTVRREHRRILIKRWLLKKLGFDPDDIIFESWPKHIRRRLWARIKKT